MDTAFIELQNVYHDYPTPDGNRFSVLKNINLQFQPGEFVALVGANGSGKTTLARHLNGLLLPSSGIVRVAGYSTANRTQIHLIRKLVGMVFQYPEDQIVASTVEEDVAFGPRNLGVTYTEVRSRVETALKDVGLWEIRQRPPHLLSAGQMQRLALAGVLAMHPRCVVFDEATTMLDPAGRRAGMRLMERLHADGVTVIFITHFMAEAARAERVIVMARGEVVQDGSAEEAFQFPGRLATWGLELPPVMDLASRLRTFFSAIPQGMLRLDDLQAAFPTYGDASHQSDLGAVESTRVGASRLIEISKLSYTYLADTPFSHQALENLNLTVNSHQSHGLLGATGSGKSTLLQHINGLLRPQSGSVQVKGVYLTDPHADVRALRRGVGLVFQNPDMQFFEQYVGDEISFGPRQYGQKTGLAQPVRRAMEQVGLEFDEFKDRITFSLSGGERRKVALASVLALQPDILLLDEPTAGLDPQSRTEVLGTLQKLQAQGVTLVLSSHHMEDLAALAAGLTVLHNGHDVISGTSSQVFSRQDILNEMGLETPIAVQSAHALRAKGWPVPINVLTPDQLCESLALLTGGVTR